VELPDPPEQPATRNTAVVRTAAVAMTRFTRPSLWWW
jgi:hypothetical protein